jgi:hypothetical protein
MAIAAATGVSAAVHCWEAIFRRQMGIVFADEDVTAVLGPWRSIPMAIFADLPSNEKRIGILRQDRSTTAYVHRGRDPMVK